MGNDVWIVHSIQSAVRFEKGADFAFGQQYGTRVAISDSGADFTFGHHYATRLAISDSGADFEFGHQYGTRVAISDSGADFTFGHHYATRVAISDSGADWIKFSFCTIRSLAVKRQAGSTSSDHFHSSDRDTI